MIMVAERPKVLLGDKTEAYGADPSNPKHYEFRYKVIELADIVSSHDDNLMPNPNYPKELQPRLRDRAASQVQIGAMAKNLNPRVLLHDSGFLDTGPMIVGSDDVLESGNGRVMALRLAAAEHRDKYNLYVDMLKANARGYGLEPKAISEMKQPVLVRERLTSVDRVAFAADANVGAVMRMSPYEQALQDSGRLSDHVIGNLEVGEEQSIDQALRSSKNRAIIQHFVGTLPANERASISESSGDINQQGLDRLKLAIFAKTYTGKAGQRLVRIFGENVDPVIKGIENATFQSLPDMAKAESLIGAGHRDKKLSIAEDLAEVIDTYASLKQQNLKASDYLAQSAMFEERLNPFQKNLLQHIDDIGRKPKYVRELLRDTAQRIIESPPPGQASFMGIESQTKEGIANVIVTKQRQELGLPEIKPTPSTAAGKRLEESHEGRAKGGEGVRAEVRQESKKTNPLPKAELPGARPEPRAKRTEHAIDIDKAIRAEEVVSPTDKEGVEKWKEHPERLDVQGVDTPPTKQAKVKKPRIKAEKPKAVKPEPTAHKEPTTYVISLDDNRSPHAVAVDRGLLAKEVVTKRNRKGVARWRHKPNQMDVRGVDTPRASRQAHGPGIMDSRGRIHKQKRGTVV
jgi:hypothetical protein